MECMGAWGSVALRSCHVALPIRVQDQRRDEVGRAGPRTARIRDSIAKALADEIPGLAIRLRAEHRRARPGGKDDRGVLPVEGHRTAISESDVTPALVRG